MSNWIAITKNGKPMIAGPIEWELEVIRVGKGHTKTNSANFQKWKDYIDGLPAYERTFEVEEGKILGLGKDFTWRFERKYEDAWFSCNANDYMQTPEEHRRAVAIPVKEDMKFSVNTGEIDDGTMVAIPVPAKEEVLLKDFVVIRDDMGAVEIWSTAKYNNYVGKAVSVGACPAVSLITTFNESDRFITREGERRFSREDMIEAAKYGYEYHANTQFPQARFSENCKNNFLQYLDKYLNP